MDQVVQTYRLAKKAEHNMATILNPGLLNRVVASTTTLNSSGSRSNATTDTRSTLYNQSAPPKAPAAVSVTNEVFSGLVTALNTYQAKQVKDKKYEYPDEYAIKFAPMDLSGKQLKKPGETNAKNSAMQNNNSARNVLSPATNSVDYTSQGWQVRAGTQIIQLIDQIMRSSTYITDQQSTIIDADGMCKANPGSTVSTAWYKVSVTAEQLKYDHLRHDHAYRLTYVISPYAINQAASQYFPDSQYRGSHKSYNYWFTGQNNQIIDFEQEYNHLYRLVISGIGPDLKKQSTVDFRDQFRRTALPTSAQHTQGGQPGYVNEPGDNLADFLYSPGDQGKIRLNIVGDPAWLQQGEVATGVDPTNFSFQPFNSDGGINYDSQQVVFDVSWNRPADYNFETGVVDLTNNKYGEPLENLTYTAAFCRSTFSKGRFTQELQGRLLVEYNKNPKALTNLTNGRPQNGTTDFPTSLSPTSLIGNTPTNNFSLNNLTRQVNDLTLGSSPWASSIQKLVNNNNPTTKSTNQVAPSNPAAQPAEPPAVPTSNGDINSNNGNTQEDQTVGYNNTDQTSQFMDKEA